ncbi:MAG: phosphotransferase [Microlunatus sp.]
MGAPAAKVSRSGIEPWLTEFTGRGDAPRLLRTRSGGRLYFFDDLVVKVHQPGTDATELAQRLAYCHGPLLAPLDPLPRPLPVDGPDLPPSLVTCWPVVEVLDPDTTPPWTESARLLAHVHGTPINTPVPGHGWPARVARAVEFALPEFVDLGRSLLRQVQGRSEPRRLLHGDWHLGQLGCTDDGWCLLDPEDLGSGDPAWDLARPAGCWAADLLSDADWHEFLDGYRAAGGVAIPATGDPWPVLDLPARCAVYVAATHPEAHDRDTAQALTDACRRMAQLLP